MKIEIESWSHTCGDGCCYTEGLSISKDGEVINNNFFAESQQHWEELFKDLGLIVEVTFKDT